MHVPALVSSFASSVASVAVWQSSIEDAESERSVVQGGVAVGKGDAMPGHADLADRPELVTALQKHVRTFDD